MRKGNSPAKIQEWDFYWRALQQFPMWELQLQCYGHWPTQQPTRKSYCTGYLLGQLIDNHSILLLRKLDRCVKRFTWITWFPSQNTFTLWYKSTIILVWLLLTPCKGERFSSSSKSTPHELRFGTAPGLSEIRIYGRNAFEHVPKEKRKALNDRS